MDDMTGPTQPLERASTLAARAYVNAEILAQEQQRIFPRHWQFACHESQLDRVGASLFVDIAGVRLVLVRTVEVSVLMRRCVVIGLAPSMRVDPVDKIFFVVAITVGHTILRVG